MTYVGFIGIGIMIMIVIAFAAVLAVNIVKESQAYARRKLDEDELRRIAALRAQIAASPFRSGIGSLLGRIRRAFQKPANSGVLWKAIRQEQEEGEAEGLSQGK